MSPRINPSVSQNGGLPAASPPKSKVNSTSPVIAAATTQQNNAVVQSRPLKANPGSQRPLPDEDTPLLPEQAAFQLPQAFVNDVQQVASRAGFVGLSAASIQRAYLQGEGVFVDTQA